MKTEEIRNTRKHVPQLLKGIIYCGKCKYDRQLQERKEKCGNADNCNI